MNFIIFVMRPINETIARSKWQSLKSLDSQNNLIDVKHNKVDTSTHDLFYLFLYCF